MQDALGMPTDIAGPHDELFRADGRLHFALDHVGDGLVRVGVERRTDTRRIVDLEERHLVTLDERLHQKIAAVRRLSFDRRDPDRLDIRIPGSKHLTLLLTLSRRRIARARLRGAYQPHAIAAGRASTYAPQTSLRSRSQFSPSTPRIRVSLQPRRSMACVRLGE